MKVRHNNRLYEVVGNWSHYTGKKFYVVEAAAGYELKPIEEAEEIPTDRWQDVTGECEVYTSIPQTTINPLCFLIQGSIVTDHSYRLRKVPVIMQNDSKHEGDAFDTTVRAAFVVERKVE